MLKFSIITLFPEMFSSLTQEGVIARGIDKKLISIHPVNLRNYANGQRKNVDDRPAGGGDGMVIRADITQKAILDLKDENSFIVHLSPSGSTFNHEIAKRLAQKEHIILLSGRYAGFDARVVNKYADMHLSIGDYVLSGGEIAAMSVIDATARFLPGMLGNEHSAKNDSFENGLLEAPTYTKPIEFDGEKIPDILLSGNHARIEEYNRNEQIRLTAQNRPDLILKVWNSLTSNEKKFAQSVNKELKEY